MAMEISATCDYAIRAMIDLGSLPEDVPALRSQVAERQGIPPSYMAKILRRLVQAGLLNSTRGTHGGFTLARPAEGITLLDIVESIDGAVLPAPCTNHDTGCRWADNCPGALWWPEIQLKVRAALADVTLESLLTSRRKAGRIAVQGQHNNGCQVLPLS